MAISLVISTRSVFVGLDPKLPLLALSSDYTTEQVATGLNIVGVLVFKAMVLLGINPRSPMPAMLSVERRNELVAKVQDLAMTELDIFLAFKVPVGHDGCAAYFRQFPDRTLPPGIRLYPMVIKSLVPTLARVDLFLDYKSPSGELVTGMVSMPDMTFAQFCVRVNTMPMHFHVDEARTKKCNIRAEFPMVEAVTGECKPRASETIRLFTDITVALAHKSTMDPEVLLNGLRLLFPRMEIWTVHAAKNGLERRINA